MRCLIETFMQILGGILGAAMSKYLTAGTFDTAPGCFVPSHGVTNDQARLPAPLTSNPLSHNKG